MVILFSGRKNTTEKQLIDILKSYGANYISDSKINAIGDNFILISEYKKTDLNIKSGIALILDDTDRFLNQTFPKGIIGICEDKNTAALKIFKNSKTPIISCGMGPLNTVTLSSLGGDTLLVSLQRSIPNLMGKSLDPAEFRIKLKKDYLPFSVMAAATVLLLNGIVPDSF